MGRRHARVRPARASSHQAIGEAERRCSPRRTRASDAAARGGARAPIRRRRRGPARVSREASRPSGPADENASAFSRWSDRGDDRTSPQDFSERFESIKRDATAGRALPRSSTPYPERRRPPQPPRGCRVRRRVCSSSPPTRPSTAARRSAPGCASTSVLGRLRRAARVLPHHQCRTPGSEMPACCREEYEPLAELSEAKRRRVVVVDPHRQRRKRGQERVLRRDLAATRRGVEPSDDHRRARRSKTSSASVTRDVRYVEFQIAPWGRNDGGRRPHRGRVPRHRERDGWPRPDALAPGVERPVPNQRAPLRRRRRRAHRAELRVHPPPTGIYG